MLIAAATIGATKGYVYIRAEYPLAIARLRSALAAMRKLGLLGTAFSAVISPSTSRSRKARERSCAGRRLPSSRASRGGGDATYRPPFPAVAGLRGKPTIINNVETLATLPNIILKGAEWYAQFGTETSKGTKTFSLVGKVRRTGLIEVPFG